MGNDNVGQVLSAWRNWPPGLWSHLKALLASAGAGAQIWFQLTLESGVLPKSLLHGCLTSGQPTSSGQAFWERWRGSSRWKQQSCKLVSRMTFFHFCCILFVRSKSASFAQLSGEQMSPGPDCWVVAGIGAITGTCHTQRSPEEKLYKTISKLISQTWLLLNFRYIYIQTLFNTLKYIYIIFPL